MPVKAIYCRDSELFAAVAAMRELAQRRINEAYNVPDAAGDLKVLASDAARELLKAADQLQYSINGNFEQPTADEEKAELRAIIDELFKDVGHCIRGTLSEQVRSGVQAVQRQRSEAFGVAASLITELNVKLEAFRWVLNSALTSPTHGTKNARIQLALEAVTELSNELQGIDGDSLERFTSWDWHKGSWNMRRLNATIQHKEAEIRQLREQLEQQQVSQKAEYEATE